MSSRRPLSVLLLVIVALVGCTGSAPEILYPDTQLSLVRDPGDGSVAEVLRLFVAIRDPDGSDDPARIYLSHSETGVFWELDVDRWVRVEYGGDMWYGVPVIRMPDGEPLPRGRYELIVEDKGLSRAEGRLFLTQDPLQTDASFPGLTVAGASANANGGDAPDGRTTTDGNRSAFADRYTMRVDAEGEVVLRVYSRSGQMVVNRVVLPGLVPQDVLRQVPQETGVQAFVSTMEDGVRRESGPYSIP